MVEPALELGSKPVIGAKTNMGLRSLLVSLFLCVVSAAVSQPVAPSGIPQESAPAADFKGASRLLAAGSLDQAAALTKQGLAQFPHNLVGLNLLGMIYQQQGKYEEEVAQFHQAVDDQPQFCGYTGQPGH
jgi:Tfp pilus assembly protein PilF